MMRLTHNLDSELSSDRVLDTAHVRLVRRCKGVFFLGCEISQCGIALSKRTLDRMLARFRRAVEPRANVSHLTKYVRLWIKWARRGVSLNNSNPSNTFNVQLPFKSI